MKNKPILLAILDGVACRAEATGNAFKAANTKNLDTLIEKYPNTIMQASGEAVGLPKGQMGNSEVGHLNIGAGRTVYQSLTLINKAIETGTINDNEVLLGAMSNAVENNSALHLIGLLSDGGVHSHINHLFGLLELAKNKGVKEVYVHGVLDGRDVAPKSALTFVEALETKMAELGLGKIATLAGRFYAMDRDKRWERVEPAYAAMVRGEGAKFASATELVETSYANEILDEFVVPAVVEGTSPMSDNDSIVFINFRPDRAIEIATALTNPEFDGFDNSDAPKNINFVCMMRYSENVLGNIAFAPQILTHILGDVLSDRGYKQLRIAETEKYAHVTFFFDGGVDKEIDGATRVLVPSPKVATYDLQPEMSAYEVKDQLLAKLEENEQDVIILNFANPDMVGHTGIFDSAVKAVETVDECIGEIYEKVNELGGVMIITSDHGNSDEVTNPDGSANTAHTTRPVPVIVTKEGVTLREDGALCDIAPTILGLLEEELPAEMTGKSLIV